MCVCVAPQLAGGGVEEAARVRGVVELCSVYRRERLCVCVCVCVCAPSSTSPSHPPTLSKVSTLPL